MTKVDQFMQQYKYDEVFFNIKKNLSNFDYTKYKILIKDALEHIDKKAYDLVTYRKIRSKIIQKLELHKAGKYELTIFDPKVYSYKLVF